MLYLFYANPSLLSGAALRAALPALLIAPDIHGPANWTHWSLWAADPILDAADQLRIAGSRSSSVWSLAGRPDALSFTDLLRAAGDLDVVLESAPADTCALCATDSRCVRCQRTVTLLTDAAAALLEDRRVRRRPTLRCAVLTRLGRYLPPDCLDVEITAILGAWSGGRLSNDSIAQIGCALAVMPQDRVRALTRGREKELCHNLATSTPFIDAHPLIVQDLLSTVGWLDGEWPQKVIAHSSDPEATAAVYVDQPGIAAFMRSQQGTAAVWNRQLAQIKRTSTSWQLLLTERPDDQDLAERAVRRVLAPGAGQGPWQGLMTELVCQSSASLASKLAIVPYLGPSELSTLIYRWTSGAHRTSPDHFDALLAAVLLRHPAIAQMIGGPIFLDPDRAVPQLVRELIAGAELQWAKGVESLLRYYPQYLGALLGDLPLDVALFSYRDHTLRYLTARLAADTSAWTVFAALSGEWDKVTLEEACMTALLLSDTTTN